MLKFHRRSCYTCKYYRVHKENTSVCLNLGRDLSSTGDPCHDRARYCELWEKRPADWSIRVYEGSAFWDDPYIPREEQLKLPGRKYTR